jgi:hypothetical protein
MATPASVQGRDVVIGGGVHGAVFAATRVAMGADAPVVLDKGSIGGIFSDLINFRMNSQQFASRRSTATGPSRVPSLSPSDDLNYLPNSEHQVRDESSGAVEFPASKDMARAIARTLRAYAEVYEKAEFTFDVDGAFYAADGTYFGTARRVIWAPGLAMPDNTTGCPAIMTGYEFLRSPVREGLDNMMIALNGGGDTAVTIAEYLLGQGFTAPYQLPRSFHWYGGDSMALTKMEWASEYHARYLGVARHLPQGGIEGVIRPYAARGYSAPAGRTAVVNGQMYDLVIDATGFKPVEPPYPIGDFITIGGQRVARFDGYKTYAIGAAANLPVDTDPYPSKFTAAAQAIYRLGPLTAAFAASLSLN